jgi:C4-dicarboxylate transporter
MKNKKWMIIAIIAVVIIVFFVVKAKKDKELKQFVAKNPSSEENKKNTDRI